MRERDTAMHNVHQAVLGSWERAVYAGKPAVGPRLDNFLHEAEEVKQEADGLTHAQLDQLDPAKKEALAYEVLDTLIGGLGVLTALGYDFETLFHKKLTTMYDKYNPTETRRLVSTGLTTREAMARQKEVFNARKTTDLAAD